MTAESATAPTPTTCPQCGRLEVDCPDLWQHRRDYGSSEWTWIREARESDRAVTR